MSTRIVNPPCLTRKKNGKKKKKKKKTPGMSKRIANKRCPPKTAVPENRQEKETSVMFDEDVVDGFAFLSFESYEDLKNCMEQSLVKSSVTVGLDPTSQFYINNWPNKIAKRVKTNDIVSGSSTTANNFNHNCLDKSDNLICASQVSKKDELLGRVSSDPIQQSVSVAIVTKESILVTSSKQQITTPLVESYNHSTEPASLSAICTMSISPPLLKVPSALQVSLPKCLSITSPASTSPIITSKCQSTQVNGHKPSTQLSATNTSSYSLVLDLSVTKSCVTSPTLQPPISTLAVSNDISNLNSKNHHLQSQQQQHLTPSPHSQCSSSPYATIAMHSPQNLLQFDRSTPYMPRSTLFNSAGLSRFSSMSVISTKPNVTSAAVTEMTTPRGLRPNRDRDSYTNNITIATSTIPPASTSSLYPPPLKPGEWNAMHARLTWEMYHYEKKQQIKNVANNPLFKSKLLRPPTHLFPPSRLPHSLFLSPHCHHLELPSSLPTPNYAYSSVEGWPTKHVLVKTEQQQRERKREQECERECKRLREQELVLRKVIRRLNIQQQQQHQLQQLQVAKMGKRSPHHYHPELPLEYPSMSAAAIFSRYPIGYSSILSFPPNPSNDPEAWLQPPYGLSTPNYVYGTTGGWPIKHYSIETERAEQREQERDKMREREQVLREEIRQFNFQQQLRQLQSVKMKEQSSHHQYQESPPGFPSRRADAMLSRYPIDSPPISLLPPYPMNNPEAWSQHSYGLRSPNSAYGTSGGWPIKLHSVESERAEQQQWEREQECKKEKERERVLREEIRRLGFRGQPQLQQLQIAKMRERSPHHHHPDMPPRYI